MMMATIFVPLLFVAALWAAGVAGRRRFHAQVIREAGELFARAGSGVSPEQLEARRADLPEPVRRYLQYALGDTAAPMRTLRLRHGGQFRTSPKQGWRDIEGEEYFTVGEPGFVWNGSIRLGPLLWIEARDRLIGGRGNMLIKICSLLKLADASGPEMDQGALLRWLAEAVWFPIGFAGEWIRWEPITSRSARATLVHAGQSVSAVLEMDEEGKLASIRAERYRAENGKGVLTPWKGVCSEYREFGGMRIPAFVEVIWELPEGDFSYAKFRVMSIEPDVAPPFFVARGTAQESFRGAR